MSTLTRCGICGEQTEIELEFPTFDGTGKKEKRIIACKCKCMRDEQKRLEQRLKFEEKQRRINDLKKLSLIDERLKDAKFSNFKKTRDNAKMVKTAMRYVDKFDELYSKNQGLLLYGDVGTGKSYIAAVIANELMERLNTVVYTSFIKLINEMKVDFDSNDFIKKINEATLLVLDDFGAERVTDYAIEKVYDIIDSRYRCGKPLIITTNIPFEQMKNCSDVRYSRIYDRIFEMCYPVEATGLSWRKKEAASRFEAARQILEG